MASAESSLGPATDPPDPAGQLPGDGGVGPARGLTGRSERLTAPMGPGRAVVGTGPGRGGDLHVGRRGLRAGLAHRVMPRRLYRRRAGEPVARLGDPIAPQCLATHEAEGRVCPDSVIKALNILKDFECGHLARGERPGGRAVGVLYPTSDSVSAFPRGGVTEPIDVLMPWASRPFPAAAMCVAGRNRDGARGSRESVCVNRHPERVVGERETDSRTHRPADYRVRPHVPGDGEAVPSLPRAHVGDVGKPGLVRPRCREVLMLARKCFA